MNLKNSDPTNRFLSYSIVITLLLSLVIVISESKAQTLKQFKDTSCLQTAKPLLLKKGEKVLINCDTAYLINAYRYQLYEKAKNYLITLAGNSDKMVLQSEGAVNQLDTYFNEIQSRYFILSQEIKKTQSDNLSTLQRVNKELEVSRSDLLITRNEIEVIKDDLKKARKKDVKNRFIFGGIGVGVGLIVGAILFH